LHLLATGEVAAEVMAPVPWFPFASSRFGRYAAFASVPAEEMRHDVRVTHPRVPVIPKVGMALAPRLMAAALRGPVKRALARKPFDLIDAHYLYPDGVAAAMLAGRLGKPFVLTARGSDVNVIARYPSPRRMIVWAASRAGRVIAVSHALRAELVKIGVDESRIEVLPNGVDLALFDAAGHALCTPGAARLLIVGHLKPGKGHRAVIEALAGLPECELEIAGDGPLRRELEERAVAAGVRERVRFLGSVPHSQLPDHYRAADALILASDREGMPNVILEALACGTPVVATRVGGVREILTEPVAGVLLDSAASSAIAEGVRQLLARRTDPVRVREFGRRFGWEHATRGQLAIFRQLAKAPMAAPESALG
jgi:glycosyltransferase involved in cell wall biosynthesis